MCSKGVSEAVFKGKCSRDVYEKVCCGLEKYKEDEVFCKEISNANEIVKSLEDSFELDKQLESLYSFIEDFPEKREDVKWFYENKCHFSEEPIRYEHINFNLNNYQEKSTYEEVDEAIFIYSMCKDTYIKAKEYLDNYFVYTLKDNKNYTVKCALKKLQKYIDCNYSSYEKIARKDRDIFKEINNTINDLEEYSKDDTFRKEVPNVFSIINNLKEAEKSKNEDEMYRALYEVSYIRRSMNLYNENREYMKFFHDNRQISQLIKVKDNINNYPSYILKLYHYVEMFDKSNTLADFLKKTGLCFQLDYLSLEKLTRWVVEGINEWSL